MTKEIFMDQEIEIEFKNLLTFMEFKELLSYYPFPQAGKKQINYYFETENFDLLKHKCALRIREKEDTFQLTLKEPQQKGVLELHESLTKLEANKWINGQDRESTEIINRLQAKKIPVHTLACFGSLTTIRYELTLDNNLLVLDQSTYNHKTDFELEMETSNYELGDKYFQDLLKKHQIPLRKTSPKIERFFSTL